MHSPPARRGRAGSTRPRRHAADRRLRDHVAMVEAGAQQDPPSGGRSRLRAPCRAGSRARIPIGVEHDLERATSVALDPKSTIRPRCTGDRPIDQGVVMRLQRRQASPPRPPSRRRSRPPPRRGSPRASAPSRAGHGAAPCGPGGDSGTPGEESTCSAPGAGCGSIFLMVVIAIPQADACRPGTHRWVRACAVRGVDRMPASRRDGENEKELSWQTSIAELQEMARGSFGRELSEAAGRGLPRPPADHGADRAAAAAARAAAARRPPGPDQADAGDRGMASARRDDLAFASITELAPRLAAKEISPVELTDAMLARIERYDPDAQQLHHRHRGQRPPCRARRRGGDHGGPRPRPAARHPGGDQGPVCDPWRGHDLRLAAVRRLGAGFRRRRGRASETRRRGDPRQDQPARAGLRHHQRQCPLWRGAQSVAARSSPGRLERRLRGRGRRRPRLRGAWAATPAPRSASRPPAAASSASSRPSAGPASSARCRCPGRRIMPAR